MIQCPTCKTEYQEQTDKCSKCGFPFAGNEREKSSFIASQIMKKGEMNDASVSIRNAKITLIIIGCVNIALSILSKNSSMIVVGILIGAPFIIFGLLVHRRPLLFLIIPLSILLLFYIGDAIVNPALLLKGFIWKAAYITTLTVAIVKVWRAQKLRKENDFLKSFK